MKKKTTGQKPKKLAPLDSRNWMSESSRHFAAEATAPPNDSGSDAPPPPTCGANSTPPESVDIEEKLTAPSNEPLPANILGRTSYKEVPTIETKVFCDGETGKWVRRVTKATFQQQQQIQPSATALTIAGIANAFCDILKLMGESMLDAMKNAVEADHYATRDLIQAHEDVHKAINSEDVAALYRGLIFDINNISTDCEGQDFTAAMSATKAEIEKVLDAFADKVVEKFEANAAHDQKQRFLDAQRPPALLWYNRVRARMKAKPCPDTLPDPPQ